jgi:Tol biopolymer transport system component
MGQLSPDARWLAYLSDESGRVEVYVQPFSPEDAAAGKPVAGKWQVSTAGGAQPRWRADGKELFYVAPGIVKLRAHTLKSCTLCRVRDRTQGQYLGAPSTESFST